MPKVFFWQDVIGNNEQFEPYQTEINQLIAGDYAALSLEKLKISSRTPIYSIRISGEKRILFTTYNGKICLLDVVLNHDYHKSRFLKNPAILNAFLDRHVEDLLAFATEGPEAKLSGIAAQDFVVYERIEGIEAKTGFAEPVALYHYQQRMIEFNETQDHVLRTRLPLAISGPAGSGKSCVAMSMLTNYVRENMAKSSAFPIVYVAHSPRLVAAMQKIWGENLSAPLPPYVDVQFKTVVELFLEQIEGDWKLAESFNFAAWYAEYLISIRHRAKAKGRGSPTIEENKSDVWREFRIISGGFGENEYIRLGEGQSTVSEERRKFIFDSYKAYISYLSKHHLIEPELAIIRESNHKLAIIDEAQDLSYGQLAGLNNMAKGKIVFMLGEHQILFDGLSRLSYLEQHFHQLHKPLNIKQLSGTYRSAQNVLNVAKTMIGFKYGATGGATDKGEVIELRSSGEMQDVVGETLWLSSKNILELSHLRNQAQAANLAVISWSEKGASEARSAIETELIFNPAEAKGLEYDTVILWDPFSGSDCRKACEKLKSSHSSIAAASGAGHLAKKGQADTSFLPYFNSIITAITRAKRKIVIVHNGDFHTIEPMLGGLSMVFPSLSAILMPKKESGMGPSSRTSNSHIDAPDTKDKSAIFINIAEWERQAAILVGEGLEDKARAIFLNRLKRSVDEYEAFALCHRIDNTSSATSAIIPKPRIEEKIQAVTSGPTKSPTKSPIPTLDEMQREEAKGNLAPLKKFILFKLHLQENPKCLDNKYVKSWLKEELSVNNPAASEKTILYWFATTEAGSSVFNLIVSKRKHNDLLECIPPTVWEQSSNSGKKSDNPSMLNLLVEKTSKGIEIIKELLVNHPKIAEKIPVSAWIMAPTTGEYINISTLFEICKLQSSGHEVLKQLIYRYPKILESIPGSAWALDHLSISPLSWLSASDSGHELLKVLITNQPHIIAAIPSSAWALARPILSHEQRWTGSPLYGLSVKPNGREVLGMLINKFPKLIEDIPVRAWGPGLPTDVTTSPLLWLTFDNTGFDVLRLIIKHCPAIISNIPASLWSLQAETRIMTKMSKTSPLYFLISVSDKSRSILKDLIIKFPEIFTAIPCNIWIRIITGTFPTGVSYSIVEKIPAEVLEILKLLKPNLKTDSPIHDIILRIDEAIRINRNASTRISGARFFQDSATTESSTEFLETRKLESSIYDEKSQLPSLDIIQQLDREDKLSPLKKFVILKLQLQDNADCIKHPYVRSWLKESLSINNPDAIEKTLLYWLISNDSGRGVFKAILDTGSLDLLECIPPEVWNQYPKSGGNAELPLLYILFSNEGVGKEIIKQLLVKYPSISERIPVSAWLHPPTFYQLYKDAEGIKIFKLFINNCPKTINLIPGGAWATNLCFSPLFFLTSDNLGLEILELLICKHPHIILSIPSDEWVKNISTDGVSPFYRLTTDSKGVEILNLIIRDLPTIISAIPFSAWWSSSASSIHRTQALLSPLYWLCTDKNGWAALKILIEKFPEIIASIPHGAWEIELKSGALAKSSPLSLLFSNPESCLVAKDLIKKFPLIFTAISYKTWGRIMLNEAPCSAFIDLLIDKNKEILEIIKLLKAHARPESPLISLIIGVEDEIEARKPKISSAACISATTTGLFQAPPTTALINNDGLSPEALLEALTLMNGMD